MPSVRRAATSPWRHGALADKSNEFLMGGSKVLPFDSPMNAGNVVHPDPAAWFVEADQSMAARARWGGRSQPHDEQLKSARVAIVSSLFLVLLGAGVLVGGHAAIDPLLKSAMEARQNRGTGEVLYAMPDGIFCRHMSFDNVTAQVTEGSLQRCASDSGSQRPPQSNASAWRLR